jgi:GT2 family glycosyltransferase
MKYRGATGIADACRASVIVPARNAADHMGRCVDAVWRDGVPVELIVVDDASTDETAALARAGQAHVIALQWHKGPAAARNIGVAASHCEMLIFVDADIEVNVGSIERMIAFLDDHPEFAAVFGSYDDSPAGPTFVSQYRDLILHFRHQTAKGEVDTFWSGFAAVRRSAFDAVGGFDEDRQDTVEDIEFGLRLRAAGHRIALQRDLLCKHHKRWTLPGMIHVDFAKRALPWARLLLERKAWSADLNLRPDRRIAVGLAGAGFAGLLAGAIEPGFLAMTVGCWPAALAIERDFFTFLWRKQRSLMLAGLALHLVHLSAAASGFAVAVLEHVTRKAYRLLGLPAVQLRSRKAADVEP